MPIKPKKAASLFIFITIMIDMIGLGLIIPSLPNIMRRFFSDELSVSHYYGYFIAVYALMQFLAAPLLGVLSDLFGRRPVLLISLFIAAFDYVLMAFAPNVEILFVGRVIAGLTGANMTVAMAYIADVSTNKNRAANFGLVGAAFGLGFIIGPAIGGLLGGFGPHYPFLVASVLNLTNFLYGLFVLPESLPIEKRKPFSHKKINPFHSLKHVLTSGVGIAFLAVHFLFQLAGQTHPSIWTLYTQTRFDWSTAQVGASLAVVGILSAVAQGGLTRVIVPKLGDAKTVLIGAFGYAITYALFGWATQGWMMYAILVFSAIFWVTPPALQSLMSQNTPSHEQGELQGSLMSLTSLASIINPLVTTQLFGYFVGAPYFFAGAICTMGGLIMFFKFYGNPIVGKSKLRKEQ